MSRVKKLPKAMMIEAELMDCTMDASNGGAKGTGIRKVYGLVFGKKGTSKAEMIDELIPFYEEEQNILNIWEEANECEREFLTHIVQCNGVEHVPTCMEIARKHKLKMTMPSEYRNDKEVDIFHNDMYKYRYLRFLTCLVENFPKTRLPILFPNGKGMAFFALIILKKVVPEFEYTYSEYKPVKSDFVICRESRLGDFEAVVRFASSEKIKVKADTFEPTKAKLAKLVASAGFEEVCNCDGKFGNPKEAKRIEDFKVALPLFVLAAHSGLVDIDAEGNVTPAKSASEFLQKEFHEQAKTIFEDYLMSTNIFEIRYVTYVTADAGSSYYGWNQRKPLPWEKIRKPVIELLKTCPVDTFVSFADFEKYMNVFHRGFLRKHLGDYGRLDYKGLDSYSTPQWRECEARVIRVILSFLSAMGMLDIAYTPKVLCIEKYSRWSRGNDSNIYDVGIAGFRLTKLGAWILGLKKNYEIPKTSGVVNHEGELLVLPDYSVMITGLKCRIKHENYLADFLTKISLDDNAAIYKIDFPSIVKAYNRGIQPKAVKAYLKKSSGRPLPDNVVRSLDDWQEKVGRVRIRTVTVLEADDDLLLQELKAIKAVGNVAGEELIHAVEIGGDSVKKAKAAIERSGWLVEWKC